MEGGIAWSRAGPVATGTLLTGLAAAMEPKSADWLPYNQGGNMKMREISNMENNSYICIC